MVDLPVSAVWEHPPTCRQATHEHNMYVLQRYTSVFCGGRSPCAPSVLWSAAILGELSQSELAD